MALCSKSIKDYLQRCFGLLLMVFVALSSTGCERSKHHFYHDPSLKLKQNDYEKILTQKSKDKLSYSPLKLRKANAKNIIPKALLKKVSINFDTKTPIRKILLFIASNYDINIVIDNNVREMTYAVFNNRSVIDVIKSLCKSTNLRYEIEGGVVYIKLDTPYFKTHKSKFLNLIRGNVEKTSIATDVFASIGGNGTNGGVSDSMDNGSSSLISSQTSNDFWKELEENISMICKSDEGSKFSMSRQAGILNVYGKDQTHGKIDRYLNELGKNIFSQVLIEAKIIEVSLNDNYKTGINWNALNDMHNFKMLSPMGTIATSGAIKSTTLPRQNIFSLGISNKDFFTSMISLMDEFGTVRTLSSPRITVLNNQIGLLKVATNRVFFRINYQKDQDTINGNSTIPGQTRASSQIHTVPIGLVMTVQPSINVDTGEVVLNLRPTISKVITEREDPAVGIVNGNVKSLIPEVQVRELASVIHAKSSEVIMLGGLMESRSDNMIDKIPGLGDVPFAGVLGSGKTDTKEIKELVVLLRATIIDPMDQEKTIHDADKIVYDRFIQDPRKFRLKQ